MTMAPNNRQRLSWILLLVLYITTSISSTDLPIKNIEDQSAQASETVVGQQQPQDDLDEAEANGKLEIVKQIKKVNDDGSYTIGYEADDGSFKIESRDVLGNIKGTYGYIDDNGDIKRVSYSTNNTTESSHTEPTVSSQPSVVQRIPKQNRTVIVSSTRRPTIVFPSVTTQSTPTSTNPNIQSIPRRRLVASTTVLPITERSRYSDYVKSAFEQTTTRSTTAKPSTDIYESSTPARLLVQAKPLLRATAATSTHQASKSEGQLVRPEITRATELPLLRRGSGLKSYDINAVPKPVSDEPSPVRGNLLRRQLSQERSPVFDPRQHVLNLQQGSGDDTVDIYSGSMTTGSPRPLFTTTLRPRLLPIVSTAAPSLHRPTIRYPTVTSYQQRPALQRQVTTEYAQESTTETTVSTDNPLPVVQIPATRGNQYVELRHPYHNGAVLVPVHHKRPNSEDGNDGTSYQQIVLPNQHFNHLQEQEQEQVPIYVRRVPKFRPIPVQVDDGGYVREYAQHAQHHTHNPVRLSPVQSHKFEYDNSIEQIKPPVSTRDFQKLLEQLIIRQSRLEQISKLMEHRQVPEYYSPQQRVAPLYQPVQFVRRPQQHPAEQQQLGTNTGPVQFLQENSQRTQTAQPQQQHPVIVRPHHSNNHDLYGAEEQQYQRGLGVTYAPQQQQVYHRTTKRHPRLLKHNNIDDGGDIGRDYLPSDVREMLLLRMLQLAINPGLPLEGDTATSATTQQSARKESIRNVQILGEEDESGKMPSRTKRYKAADYDYYD